MTFEMARAGLLRFPIQYSEEVVKHINEVYSGRTQNNADLREIGKAVSPHVRHTLHGRTTDGYFWFGRLEYVVKGAKVAVLFPWAQDWDNPESPMDRSIGVYSDRGLPDAVVTDLLERIGYQMALHRPFCPRSVKQQLQP